MGIIDPDCIPEAWLAPIGRDLVLSPGIVGLNAPDSLDTFTELVLQLRERLAGRAPQPKENGPNAVHLKVKAFISFLPNMPTASTFPRENARLVEFDGSIGTWPAEKFEKEYLLVSYPFHIKEAGTTCVMFNSREACRVSRR